MIARARYVLAGQGWPFTGVLLFGALLNGVFSVVDPLVLKLLVDRGLLAPGVGAQGAGPAELRVVFGEARRQVLASSSREVLGAGPSVGALVAAAERTGDAVLAALA